MQTIPLVWPAPISPWSPALRAMAPRAMEPSLPTTLWEEAAPSHLQHPAHTKVVRWLTWSAWELSLLDWLRSCYRGVSVRWDDAIILWNGGFWRRGAQGYFPAIMFDWVMRYPKTSDSGMTGDINMDHFNNHHLLITFCAFIPPKMSNHSLYRRPSSATKVSSPPMPLLESYFFHFLLRRKRLTCTTW